MIDMRLRDVSGAPARWQHFWPVLMGPVAIGVVILARIFLPADGVLPGDRVVGWEWALLAPAGAMLIVCFVTRQPAWALAAFAVGTLPLFLRGINTLDVNAELVAPWVLLGAAGLYWVRCIVTRNYLYTVVTVVAGTLLLRELHWAPAMKIATYPILGVCVAWVIANRDLLARPLRDRRHAIWLIAVVATYVLSQLIARRVFKFMPGEDDIHSKIEEYVEVAGHLALVTASLVGSWEFYEIKQSPCSLRRGFEISPTGRTLAMLKRRLPAKADPDDAPVADGAGGDRPDDAQTP